MGYAVKLQKKGGSEELHYVVANIINGTYSTGGPNITALTKKSVGDSSKFVYSITWYYGAGSGWHSTVFRTLSIVGKYLHLNYCYVAASTSSGGNRGDINIIIDGVSTSILHAQSGSGQTPTARLSDYYLDITGKEVYIEYNSYTIGNNTIIFEMETLSYYY